MACYDCARHIPYWIMGIVWINTLCISFPAPYLAQTSEKYFSAVELFISYSTSWTAADVDANAGSFSLLKISACLQIAGAILSFIAGVVHIAAMCKRMPKLLYHSIILGSMTILLYLVATGLAAAYFSNYKEGGYSGKVSNFLVNGYQPLPVVVSADPQTADGKMTIHFNNIQLKHKCCGHSSYKDYADLAINWNRTRSTYTTDGTTHKQLKFPIVCCSMMSEDLYHSQQWSSYYRYLKDTDCPNTGVGLRVTGCIEEMQSAIMEHSLKLLITPLCLAVYMVAYVLTAFLLIKFMKKSCEVQPGRKTEMEQHENKFNAY